jgi:hypothetical protein
VKRHTFVAGDTAVWHDGLQAIPVVIESVGRDAVGIYCRVQYLCNDGELMHDRVHPSSLKPVKPS